MDTDHVSHIERGGQSGLNILRRLQAVAPDDYGTTIISFKEQVEGRLAEIKNAHGHSEKTIVAFSALNDTLRFFSSIAVWQYNAAAAVHMANFRDMKLRVGTQDLLIASIALANDATLLTCNAKDFSRVPNLRIADWTV